MQLILAAALVGLIALLIVALIFLINDAGTHDVFFTKPPERTAVEVQVGGRFHRFILVYQGHILVKNDRGIRCVVKRIEDLSPLERAEYAVSRLNPLNWFERFGVYWVGIPPFYRIGEYRFKWSEPQSENGKVTRLSRDEMTKYLYVNRFTYFPFIAHAYTKGNIPVSVSYLLVVQVQDLYLARYGTEDWYVYVTGEADALGREYIGGQDFAHLNAESKLTEPQTGQPHDEGGAFNTALAVKAGEIRALSGVMIFDAKIEEVNIANEAQHKDLVLALGAEVVAEQEAKAAIARAKGLATAADSDVLRINKVYGAIEQHPHGVQIRQMEALERTAEKGNGVNWVIPSSIGEIVRKAISPPAAE